MDQNSANEQTDADGVSRRAAIRQIGGGLAVAAAAAGLASSSPQAAAAAQADCDLRLYRADVAVTVSEKFTIDNTIDLIKATLERTGCSACGFLGLDFRIHGPRPEEIVFTLDDPLIADFDPRQIVDGIDGYEVAVQLNRG